LGVFILSVKLMFALIGDFGVLEEISVWKYKDIFF